MATLQSFQVEIEDIRNRELAKARAQSQPEAFRKGHIDQKSAPKARKKAVGTETPVTPAIPKLVDDDSAHELTDIEHSIEVRHSLYTLQSPFNLTYSRRLECATSSNRRRHSCKRFNCDAPNPTRRGVSPSTRRSSTEGTIIY
jgi:hypothetical protein